ncbi:MAG: Holliday junction resolvase RuvX [Sedimentisphaerales bacterium]|nr:Holliday junction resolvase RuvX [Sedimentisphaerales bacterium]
MRYLSIDYGLKRTGLAICDKGEMIVSPLAVIDSRKGLIEKIIKIIKNENVEAIVVGLPLNMDDSKGSQAQLSEKFAERLKKEIQIPLYLQDERLSSFAAEEKLAPAQYTRGKKKKRLDAIAAAEILNFFLQQKSSDNQVE